MQKMQVNITLEYNNIQDPNNDKAEEIIQNLNLLVTQCRIQEAASADNINVEDVKIIDEETRYSKFRKWLMSCPVKYKQDDINDFDDDSIVFLTGKIKKI